MKNEKIDKIMDAYKTGEKTLEETNKALKEAGVNFHLKADVTDENGHWNKQEMEEGFIPGEPAKDVQRKPDMSRREDLAGKTILQKTTSGKYAVTYNELGYATKAVKE